MVVQVGLPMPSSMHASFELQFMQVVSVVMQAGPMPLSMHAASGMQPPLQGGMGSGLESTNSTVQSLGPVGSAACAVAYLSPLILVGSPVSVPSASI